MCTRWVRVSRIGVAVLCACGVLVPALWLASGRNAGALPVVAADGVVPEDSWGTPVDNLTTTYAVYKQDFVYGTTPFSITDMRTEPRNIDKEGYEIRALTVYRAHDGQRLLTGQPVVFFVHGGGWTDWYRGNFGFVATSMTGMRGWVTVVIDYRLTSDQVFLADKFCRDRATCALPANEALRTKAAWYPDNIEDVAAAFLWTVNEIGHHGGDPNRIVLLGHSAGAHLASLLATRPPYASMVRPHTRGLVSMSGGYDLNAFDQSFWMTPINQTFAGGFSNVALLADGSPATYVTSQTVGLPPTLLLYAQTELLSLTEQQIGFTNRLTHLGFDVTTVRLDGYDHSSEMRALADVTAAPTALIVDWIETVVSERVYLPLAIR